MKRKPARATATRDLIRLLWQQPLVAVPFAIFFGVLFGGFPRSVMAAYPIALVFSVVIGLGIWAVRWPILKNHQGLTTPTGSPRR